MRLWMKEKNTTMPSTQWQKKEDEIKEYCNAWHTYGGFAWSPKRVSHALWGCISLKQGLDDKLIVTVKYYTYI